MLEVPQFMTDIRQRTVARLPEAAQALYDQRVTQYRLPDQRNAVLTTNLTTAVAEGEAPRRPLDYVREEVGDLVENKVVTIIPFSGRNHPHEGPYHPETGRDFDRSAEKAVESLEQFYPADYVFLHTQDDKPQALARAQAIYVCGGNSSGHSANLFGYENFNGEPIDNVKGANTKPLHRIIRMKVADGTPYVGTSAGQMVATGNVIPHLDAPSIIHIQRTRSGEVRMSMPFDGMNLLGNLGLAAHPHYNPDRLTNYGDNETQFIRVMQILERNPWLTVIGMQDNSALEVKGRTMKLVGDKDASAYVMSYDRDSRMVTSEHISYGHDLSHLLDTDLTTTVEERFAHR